MKKTYIALALALTFPAQAMAADVQVRVNPQTSVVNLQDSLLIDIVGNYVDGGNVLGGAFDLSFDPSVLQVVNVTLTAPQDIAGTNGTVDNVLGKVGRVGFASFNGVVGDFDLATIEFKAVGAGTTQLSVADSNDLVFVWANDVSGGQVVNFIGVNGSASVVAVPEAETYAMMLAGLGLVGFAASRRKSVK